MIKVNNIEISKDIFGAGEFKLENVNIQTVPGSISVEWNFESNDEALMLKFIKDHIDSIMKTKSFDKNILLYLPYIPYARMDRVKNTTDIFTLKYFANFINSLKFDKVYVFDPHSNVSLAVIDNVVQIPVEKIFEKLKLIGNIDKKNFVVVFPDYSAYKRYSEYFDGYKMCYFEKKRNWETHKIEDSTINYNGLSKDDFEDMSILVVDDIVSYGGTFYRCIEVIRSNFKNIRKIYTYASHTENIVDTGNFYKEHIDKGIVYKHFTTDSIYNKNLENIVVITL